MITTVQIQGVEDVNRRLNEVPAVLAAKALGTALDRGIGVIAAEVETLTPEDTGDLKENIITAVEVNLQHRSGSAVVGFSSALHERTGKPMDQVALWVEFGHRLLNHQGHQIGHVPAHPFMRIAYEVSADQAIDAFANTLLAELAAIFP